MAVRMIKSVQKIPASPEVVWKLFSDPENLKQITPPGMRLRVTSGHGGGQVFTGQFIEYRLRPLFGIQVYWKTEIIEVKELEYFIDEQRKGPYRFWRHEHYFRPIEGGVEMKDLVRYENPFGFIGEWANALFVRKKLRELFEYRYQKAEEIFGKWEGQWREIEIS